MAQLLDPLSGYMLVHVVSNNKENKDKYFIKNMPFHKLSPKPRKIKVAAIKYNY